MMQLRVLRLPGREFRDVLRAATATHRRLRDHLVTITVVTVDVDLLGAVAALLLERHSQQTEIKTFGSAVRPTGHEQAAAAALTKPQDNP